LDGAREAEARVAYSRASELMPQERTAERAYVLGAESRVLMLGGYMAEARVRAEEAIALARQIGDRAVEMSGLSTLAGALGSAALFDEAEETGRQALALVDQAGVADELGRAYGNTAEVVEHAGRVEESLQTTLDGVAEARRRGAERSWGAFLSGEAARRMLVLGRIAEASAMVDHALAMGPTGIASTSLQQGRAEVELALGDKQSARAAMDRGMTGNFELSLPLWDGQRMAIAAELELWDGDPDSALRLVMGTLERLEERECLMYTAPLYALGGRAHADKAGTARVLKRAGDVAAARAAATALADRFDSVAAATLSSSATIPHCDAWRAQLDAESTRIDGSGDAGAWRVARQRWDELGAVLRSLYCAWREVDALLAANDGDRAMAREVLRDAHAIATRHGARLMLGEFEALARRARIDQSGADGDADPAAAPSPAEGAGLTPREAEVLALVAEGRTNRQIGEELFISDKTASVHVSRILAKLDAANRGEAAAMARRLGISASAG
jgi:DNA-binding CsgD family transcriptional regulator/tetratricopeptide (TPR) repeat protein